MVVSDLVFPMVATPLLALSTDIQTAIVLTLISNVTGKSNKYYK